MSTQHTPAPWLMADHNFVYALNDQKSNRFCLSVTAGHEILTRSTSIRTSPEEIAANAALICAAPDLLEALEEIDADSDSRLKTSTWNKLKAAIAKAKQLTNNNQ